MEIEAEATSIERAPDPKSNERGLEATSTDSGAEARSVGRSGSIEATAEMARPAISEELAAPELTSMTGGLGSTGFGVCTENVANKRADEEPELLASRTGELDNTGTGISLNATEAKEGAGKTASGEENGTA